MAKSLYLDTARLGRMTPSARKANIEFARFAAEEVCPPDFVDFLRLGADACPTDFRDRYPELGRWAGVTGLKSRLRDLAHSPTDLPVLLANRSAQLMKFAARWLFRPCENVLVIDATWPAYRSILETECRHSGRRISTVPIHEAVMQSASEEQIMRMVETAFNVNECDGLFLPAVTHDGLRLPVPRLVQTLEAKHGAIPVVIDGAQDFCHTPSTLHTESCDLYLAGCHKWLGGYFPMGLCFYGRRRSVASVETILHQMLIDGDLDDPLLSFSNQLETDTSETSAETVSLGSLFSTYGAALDASEERESEFQVRHSNTESVADLCENSPWRRITPAAEFQSAVLMLEATSSQTRGIPAQALRTAFQQEGISLSAYHGGQIRISMPETPLSKPQLRQIQSALHAVS